MTLSRQRMLDFYDARRSHDPAAIATFLHDDVEWSISGPVDLLPFCGTRRGKDAVLDVILRVVPSLLTITKLEVEAVLVEGDRAAGFSRLTGIQPGTQRTIAHQRAEFFLFRDDKMQSYRAILDSLDMAEQVLGHPIDRPTIATPTDASESHFVA